MDLDKKNIKNIAMSYNFEDHQLHIKVVKSNNTEIETSITLPNTSISNLFFNTTRTALSAIIHDKESLCKDVDDLITEKPPQSIPEGLEAIIKDHIERVNNPQPKHEYNPDADHTRYGESVIPFSKQK